MKQPTVLVAMLLGCWLPAAAAYGALSAPSAQRLLAELSSNDVTFVARLISIAPTTGHCPGSGIAINYQSATYRVERVMMGTIKKSVVVVGHVLVSGASGLDPDTGCLSPTVFKAGARFVVLARFVGQPEFDFESTADAQSVFPADKRAVHELARVVADCSNRKSPPESATPNPMVADENVVTNRTLLGQDGFSIDLRDPGGLGLILTNEYFGRLGVGWPDEVAVRKVALSPSAKRVAIEVSNTEGVGAMSLVGFIGKMCPPRVLSPIGIPTENGWSANLPKAASPVWINDREIAFIGTSLIVTDAEPWIYIEDIETGRVRSIRVQAPVLSLSVRDKRLVCVTAEGEVPMSLAEVQLPSIVAK